MRAMVIDGFGGADQLRPAALPNPIPGTGEILIRTVAAGVNPQDWKTCEGRFREQRTHRFPLVPGWDVAGVVESLGPGVTRFRKGDKVWACALKSEEQWGGYAELVVVAETSAANMPAKLLFEEAAAIPLAGLAALQSIQKLPGLGGRHRVLIHGASGGVGHLALQLARNSGARTLATAGPEHRKMIADLGASVTIDYTEEDFRESVRRHAAEGVDLIVDTIGGDTLDRSYDLLRPGGVLVGLVDPPDATRLVAPECKALALEVIPSGNDLDLLTQLADAHRLRPHVEKIYPLKSAAEALARCRSGHVGGKLVLNL